MASITSHDSQKPMVLVNVSNGIFLLLFNQSISGTLLWSQNSYQQPVKMKSSCMHVSNTLVVKLICISLLTNNKVIYLYFFLLCYSSTNQVKKEEISVNLRSHESKNFTELIKISLVVASKVKAINCKSIITRTMKLLLKFSDSSLKQSL